MHSEWLSFLPRLSGLFPSVNQAEAFEELVGFIQAKAGAEPDAMRKPIAFVSFKVQNE